MLNLPVYLRGSSYYLHLRVHGRQLKKSLKTGDRKTAMLLAVRYLSDILPMTIRKYEIDLGRGVFKSDGEDDHRRLRETLDDLERLGKFQPIPPPQPPRGELPKETSGLRIPDLVEKFFQLRKNLKPATSLSYKTTANEFAGFINNPFIQTIDKGDITRYQEHIARFNEVRTIDNKIGALSSLFNFAIKQGYYFKENPAIGRKLMTNKDKAAGGYSIFEKDEIKEIFAPEHLAKWKKGDPDFYYCVMLALLTGCRISEITSLEASQVRSEPVPFIKIKDSKTTAGVREIPLPPEFFKEFQSFKPASGPIFKYQKRLGKGSGNAVSQKFKRHLTEIGVTRDKLVFHSLRKFLNDHCLKLEVRIEPRCQFFGHELENVNVTIYASKFNIEHLAKTFVPIQTEILEMISWRGRKSSARTA